MIWLDKPKENLETQFSVNFYNFFVVTYSHADSVAVHSNNFLRLERVFDAKLLLIVHAVAQNFVFVLLNREQLKKILTTNWSAVLKRQ